MVTRKKRPSLAWLLTAAILLLPLPLSAWAAGDEAIGQYVDVAEDGAPQDGSGTDHPERAETDNLTGQSVTYSKTIAATAEDDVFAITLNVETTQKLAELPAKSNVVLVIDVSSSMDFDLNYSQAPYTPSGITRWHVLREALRDLITSFLSFEGNQVSIVAFGGLNVPKADEKEYRVICDWTDSMSVAIASFNKFDWVCQYQAGNANVTDKSLRHHYFDDTIDDLGATNAQAGFRGASGQLLQLKNTAAYDGVNNFIVYMSDGEASTCYDSPFFESAKDEHFVLEQYYQEAAADARQEAQELKVNYPETNIYTIGFKLDGVVPGREILDPDNNNAVDYVNKYYGTADADELVKAYQALTEIVTLSAQAWVVMDPMSKWVTLETDFSGNSAVSTAAGTITWDVRKATPVENTLNQPSSYIYTLPYQVRLDTAADGFRFGPYYPTNKATSLTYVFSEANGLINPETAGKAAFLIPTVRGFGASVIYMPNYTGAKQSAMTDAVSFAHADYTLRGTGTFTRSGYTLTGWNTQPDGGGTAYSAGKAYQVATELELTHNGDQLTLYAQWKSNGGGDGGAAANGSITKRASVPTVKAGDTYTYTITASNNGNAAWNSVTATDKLPVELSYDSYTSPDGNGVTITNKANLLTIHFGNIAAGAAKTVTITVKVNEGVAAGTVIPNSVTTGDGKTAADPVKPVVEGENPDQPAAEGENPTTPPGKSAKINDSGSNGNGDGLLNRGEKIAYTITYKTEADVESLGIADYIPLKTTYVADSISFSASADGLAHTMRVLTDPATGRDYAGWHIQNIPAGTTITVGFTVTVDNNAGGRVYNIGTVYADSRALTTNEVENKIDTPDLPGAPNGNGSGIPGITIDDAGVPLSLFVDAHWGYIIGYPDGTARPEANVTRAEVATVFFRMLTDAVRTEFWSQHAGFTDVASGDWYNNAVAVMSEMGIISGYADGSFQPNASITRAEIAKIAAEFALMGGNPPLTTQDFSDTHGHWAEQFIDIAARAGWVKGYEDGSYRPDQTITRAELMTLVNRVLKRQPESVHDLRPDMITWSDNANTGAWYYLAVQEATNSHDHKYKGQSASGASFHYETWTLLQGVRDWAALEQVWSTANSAPDPSNLLRTSSPTQL